MEGEAWGIRTRAGRLLTALRDLAGEIADARGASADWAVAPVKAPLGREPRRPVWRTDAQPPLSALCGRH